MTGTDTPRPHCHHVVDNHRGILWYCVRNVHIGAPDAHYLVASHV